MPPQQGYGMPQPYGAPGGFAPPVRQLPVMTPDDLDRVTKTIHVAGIRGLKGQPGIAPGEEISEEDLAAFFGNDGEVRPLPFGLLSDTLPAAPGPRPSTSQHEPRVRGDGGRDLATRFFFGVGRPFERNFRRQNC